MQRQRILARSRRLQMSPMQVTSPPPPRAPLLERPRALCRLFPIMTLAPPPAPPAPPLRAARRLAGRGTLLSLFGACHDTVLRGFARSSPLCLLCVTGVVPTAMCHGKAKLVSIDCEPDGAAEGALALLSVESDAAAMPLEHWKSCLALPAQTPHSEEEHHASLAGRATPARQPPPSGNLYLCAAPLPLFPTCTLPLIFPTSRAQPCPSPPNVKVRLLPAPWSFAFSSGPEANTLAGALARLSHSYCAVVRGPGVCTSLS